MTPTITQVRARPVMVPLKRPPIAASGTVPEAPLMLLDIDTDAGMTGNSYLFAFTRGMLKPLASCIETLAELMRGDALVPYDIDIKLRRQLTLLDTPGIVGLALAGIDMAVWDALAKVQGLPLVRVLGGDVKPIRAYNSCGLWIQDPPGLADEAEQLLAEGGFTALKLRLGRADFTVDLTAVRQVKQRLGDDIVLMSDFNQNLTVNEAIRRGQILDDEGLYWIEEPVRHDNYTGCAKIAAEIRTPIQIGENLRSPMEMQQAIAAEAAEYYMTDVQRIGGVTGWMRAAALAHANGLEMSSHLFPEFSVHLLAVTPTCHWLEYMDWSNAILQEPLEVTHGAVLIPDRPGAGIAWNEDAVKHYLVT